MNVKNADENPTNLLHCVELSEIVGTSLLLVCI